MTGCIDDLCRSEVFIASYLADFIGRVDLAARWLLTREYKPQEDTLLIFFDDGAMAATLIVRGCPNHGCISGANELGHMRLPVKTEICYCGGVGCLEWICDSVDLNAHGLNMSLAEALSIDQLDHPAMWRMIELMGIGFANIINFTRVSIVIIASQLPNSADLIQRLIKQTQSNLLSQICQRVRFDLWPETDARSARTSGYLAIANLYLENWLGTYQEDSF
jgi:predicted NBD/HSP70 family sugar kinase